MHSLHLHIQAHLHPPERIWVLMGQRRGRLIIAFPTRMNKKLLSLPLRAIVMRLFQLALNWGKSIESTPQFFQTCAQPQLKGLRLTSTHICSPVFPTPHPRLWCPPLNFSHSSLEALSHPANSTGVVNAAAWLLPRPSCSPTPPQTRAVRQLVACPVGFGCMDAHHTGSHILFLFCLKPCVRKLCGAMCGCVMPHTCLFSSLATVFLSL